MTPTNPSNPLSRREFAELASLAVAGIVLPGTERAQPRPPQAFALEETTIAQLQDGMKAGRLTARGVTQAYRRRAGIAPDGAAVYHAEAARSRW